MTYTLRWPSQTVPFEYEYPKPFTTRGGGGVGGWGVIFRNANTIKAFLKAERLGKKYSGYRRPYKDGVPQAKL